MASQLPPLPPGFQLVEPRASLPPLPPGFELVAPLARPKTFQRDEDEALYREKLAAETASRGQPMVPFYASEPGGPERNLAAERRAMPPQQAAAEDVGEQRAVEAEQQAFEDSRTLMKRATDASTFALSAPFRALSRGDFGLGDVIEPVIPGAKHVYDQAEQDFARANEWWLEPVAQVGEAGIGVPLLQSMGAVPGQVLRTARAALPQRAARTAAPPRSATPAQAYGPAERIADRAAFQAEEIPEFAPAFGSKGLARTARTIEETPLVGGSVKVPKNAVEQAMAARQTQVARQAGPELSQEGVGDIAQHGLRRFRTANLQDIERARLQGLGITPDRPPQQVRGNVNVTRPGQLDTSQMTARELDTAAASRVNLPGSTRSRIEDLSPQEVQRIVDLPAHDTSFATKASALYRQADDALPDMMRANNTVNPGMLATRNAGNVVQGLLRQEQAAGISGGVLQGRFGNLVQRLGNAQSNFTLDALRAARTEVGRALGNFGEFDVRLDRGQLKQLYGALSDDYQSGLVALAARARRASRLAPTDPNHVRPAVANAADRALQRYRVADRYFRQGVERMDRFMQVLGADTLEQASRRIGQYLRENTQNVRALESMSSALRPEEWRAVLGNVVEGLGRLTPGAREAEKIFSFERFATDWNKISQNPRVMGLFRRSLGEPVVRSLNNMGRIAERMKYYETTKNYSGSGYTALGGAGLATLLVPQSWPLLIGAVAGTGVAGKVLTSRAFATWVNSLNHAQIRVGSSVAATRQALRPHIQRLSRLAQREPDPEIATALAGLSLAVDEQLQALEAQAPQ